MATYVNDLRLKEISTGDESGTWGTSTNTNLELIAEAFSYGTEAITTNADTHTTTIADGSTDPGRSFYLKYTGTLDSACTITIGPNTVSKLWFIENATSGSQNIIISQGSGANITIPNGHVKAIYSDGAGSGAAMIDAFTDLNVAGDFFVGDDLTLLSDAAVLGFGADTDTTLTHVADTGLLLNSTRQLQFGDSGTYIHQSADGVLDLVSDTELELNATTIDINGNADISGTLGVTGAVTADAGVSIDNITIDGTEIDLSSGDLTVDVAGNIILDADGDSIKFADGGTEYGKIYGASSNFYFNCVTQDKDIIFVGDDGGSSITALTLDMSEAGKALFNGGADFNEADLTNVGTIYADQYLGDADADTGMVLGGSNVLTLHTNNAERMRISESGCVGVGSTSDRSLGTNIGTLVVNGSAGGGLWLSPGDSSAMTSKIYAEANGSVGDLIINNGTGVGSGGIRIQTNSTERWRIDSAGRMTNAFDAISSSFLQIAGNSVSGGVVAFYDPDVSVSTGNVILQLTFTVDEDCTNGKFAQFSDGNTNCGSISAASGTSVAFNTTSDERLKKNIVDASSQLNVIKNIKVREFDWKNNNHHDVGMIAQELNTVIPNVVIEGSDEHEMNWGVDYGKLTPYLIKAVQELSATIDDLKTRVETLEG